MKRERNRWTCHPFEKTAQIHNGKNAARYGMTSSCAITLRHHFLSLNANDLVNAERGARTVFVEINDESLNNRESQRIRMVNRVPLPLSVMARAPPRPLMAVIDNAIPTPRRRPGPLLPGLRNRSAKDLQDA